MRWEELDNPFEIEREEDPYVTGNGHEDSDSDSKVYHLDDGKTPEEALHDEYKDLFDIANEQIFELQETLKKINELVKLKI